MSAVSRSQRSPGPYQHLGKHVERQVNDDTLEIKEVEFLYEAQDDTQTGGTKVHGTPLGIKPLQDVV